MWNISYSARFSRPVIGGRQLPVIQSSLQRDKLHSVKVMSTIASQLKAPSQNTPQSSIILQLGVSPGSWLLSGREFHRQLSLFNPHSVLFQNFLSNDIIS